MSSSTNTKASIAVLGGTGTLGHQISTILLAEFRDSFSSVRIFSRDPSSSKAQEFAKKGAEVVALDVNTLESALAGVDAVVNALPSSLPVEVRQKVNAAAIKSGVKVYFLSEFGIDHRVVDFSGYETPEWTDKKKLAAETRALAKDKTKVLSVYNSLFTEFLVGPFGPYLGFDLEKNVFTPYGPATQRFATTAIADIGRSVARLALLALDPATASRVPDEVRIAGSIVTVEEVRDIVARVKGVPKGEIKSEDIEKVKQRLREQKGSGNFLDYLRVSLGENWADYSQNENELVNPGQRLWKWTTVEDLLRGSA